MQAKLIKIKNHTERKEQEKYYKVASPLLQKILSFMLFTFGNLAFAVNGG